jgi:hypothetical protein
MKIRRFVIPIIGEIVFAGVTALIEPRFIWETCFIVLLPLILIAIYGDRWLEKLKRWSYHSIVKRYREVKELYRKEAESSQHQQALSQTIGQLKENIEYIFSKILPLSSGNKTLSLGVDLAQHEVHLSVIFRNLTGLHFKIESIKPQIQIADWKLGGQSQISQYWENVESCRIEIVQPISPAIAKELREAETQLVLSCDLELDIWLKEGNIKSQARYSFAV